MAAAIELELFGQVSELGVSLVVRKTSPESGRDSYGGGEADLEHPQVLEQSPSADQVPS